LTLIKFKSKINTETFGIEPRPFIPYPKLKGINIIPFPPSLKSGIPSGQPEITSF
jgi:hypothetical protein